MPRSIKNHLPNQHPNLERFGGQLGSILRRFWGPRWSQVGTQSLQNSISKSIKKLITFRIPLGTDFKRFWAPTWPQLGPPRRPHERGSRSGSRSRIASWPPLCLTSRPEPHFGTILMPTWPQFTSQLGAKIRQKSVQEPPKIHPNFHLVIDLAFQAWRNARSD